MSTSIIVARHGETDWNSGRRWQGNADVPLNSNGVLQARELAGKLRGVKLDAIYSSDLKRARKTAEIVADSMGSLDVTADSRLRERNIGILEGLGTAEVIRITGLRPDNLSIMTLDHESVESLDAFKRRLADAIQSIIEVHVDQNVLVVAHGGVMMGLCSILLEEKNPKKFTNGEMLRLSYDGSWSMIRSPASL